MLIFHGGFNRKQVNNLLKGKYVLYKKGHLENFRINWCNTFKYSNIDKYNKKIELYQNILDENYKNQWIHCYKYLYNAINFCDEFNDYIVVFDIDEAILNKYIGIGKYRYEGYKIEYRIPRSLISSENIVDVIRFRNNRDDLKKLEDKYKFQYRNIYEDLDSIKILKKIKQKCYYI